MNTPDRRSSRKKEDRAISFFNLRPSAFICGFILLVTTGCGATKSFGEWMSGNTALANSKKMENPYNPDDRREGLIYLADHDFGHRPPYTTRYQQIAANDPDPLVRATAIRSLNISRDKSATPVFVKALYDPSPLVRLEAAKALYRVPDEAAIPRLLAAATANEENKDVRIAATEALQHYPRLDVARTVVSLLNTRDFGIAWQARRTLKRLTGKDLDYDESAWLQFLTGPGKPLG